MYKLNTQSDSIKAKLFSTWLTLTTFHIVVFNHVQGDFTRILNI